MHGFVALSLRPEDVGGRRVQFTQTFPLIRQAEPVGLQSHINSILVRGQSFPRRYKLLYAEIYSAMITLALLNTSPHEFLGLHRDSYSLSSG